MTLTPVQLVLTYLGSLAAFLVVDLTWLGFVAKGVYDKYLGSFMAESVNWTSALIFYALYVVGLMIFAIVPAVQAESLGRAALLGGLFGFFAYATYELTNHAVIKDWPLGIVFIDIAWGVALGAVVAVAGYGVAQLVG